jgi:hypothetical protein
VAQSKCRGGEIRWCCGWWRRPKFREADGQAERGGGLEHDDRVWNSIEVNRVGGAHHRGVSIAVHGHDRVGTGEGT